MTLEELSEEIDERYDSLDEELLVDIDRQARTELALLQAALGTQDPSDLVRRAINLLFQSTVDTGGLDMHLRREYDVTYDEYLSGMTYDDMRGGGDYQLHSDDDRRYQF